jgi:hypothetical protein
LGAEAMGRSGAENVLDQPVEKFKIRRPFKNGDMQGREKIQGARCIAYT